MTMADVSWPMAFFATVGIALAPFIALGLTEDRERTRLLADRPAQTISAGKRRRNERRKARRRIQRATVAAQRRRGRG